MTLKLSKVRGHADQYTFIYDNGSKVVSWQVNGNDVDTEVLTDVVDTVHPAIAPTVPQYPIHGLPIGPVFVQPALPGAENYGAEAADRAAREEEMRLRNGGAALAKGIGMAFDDIPIVDTDRNDLPGVNWGA